MCWIPIAASRPQGSRSNWSSFPTSAPSRVVTRTVTNSDGRTDQPLIGGRPVPIGRYELTVQRRQNILPRGSVPMSDPPFLDQIPLRFSVSDPEGHLHVPLLVTPWSYATYRGS